MKLTLAVLMIAVAMAAAVEDSADKLIMICGDDLIAAFKQACEEKRVEYLLDHGLYDPQAKPKYQHQVQHDLDHKHGHNHGHNHGHDHGLDRNLYHSDNNNNAPKKEINESDRKMKYIWFLLALVAMRVEAYESTRFYCGRQLGRVLEQVCDWNSIYSLGGRRKRSPGITEECCYKPCDISVIKEFC